MKPQSSVIPEPTRLKRGSDCKYVKENVVTLVEEVLLDTLYFYILASSNIQFSHSSVINTNGNSYVVIPIQTFSEGQKSPS